MSFKTDITKEVKALFVEMLTVQVSVTYKSVTFGAYNPTTGTAGETIVAYVVTGMMRHYNTEDTKNSEIALSDTKLEILQSDLSAITPNTNDRIAIGGDDYDIINVKKDTSESRWIFQLRKK